MIFFDAHVHIYPEQDGDLLCDSFMRRARQLAPQAKRHIMAIMLREGQGNLDQLLQNTAVKRKRWQPLTTQQVNCARLSDGEDEIILLAARQIACRERLELLGFFCQEPIEDGLPLAATTVQLRDSGALIALAWGLGKWVGGRAAVVSRFISENADSGDVVICDSALRPTFWPRPRAMRQAGALGWPLVYGSDPLPRSGDEREAGRYATLIEGTLRDDTVTEDLRQLLLEPRRLSPVGRRHGLAGTMARLT